MRSSTALAAVVCAMAAAGTAGAAPPAPSGPHPRIWLDDATRARLDQLADQPGTATAAAVKHCAEVRARPDRYTRGGWQGFAFVKPLSSCLVAYAAKGREVDAATAIEYFEVLLDDYQRVGDGAGGDDVVRHDTGYAMRTFGAYAGLAYDWLHGAPGMTADLREKARRRFAAWTDWYREEGYLPRTPGANYHAGWVLAATLIAIAQSGEAADAGDALWRHVTGDIAGTDLAAALGPGGVLDGGDWPEGWQYGPLAVLSYQLSARALAQQGVEVPGSAAWAHELLLRHIHGQVPGRARTFAVGDTGEDTVNLPVSARTLYAVLLGPAPEDSRKWAAHELDRLKLGRDELLLFSALAEAVPVEPEPFPRDREPTAYLAPGSGTFYFRSAFAPDATWGALRCAPMVVPDHVHPDAGNFVLSRGADDLVVDPSPYGSLSSLTSNAPTVVSHQLSESYRPSQGPWGDRTRLLWYRHTTTGVTAARCSYADQYARKGQKTDIESALRDFVLLARGGDGTAIVIDRARTGAEAKFMDLRFRTATQLALDGDVARAEVGASSLAIRRVTSSGGTPSVRAMPTGGDCWEVDRGKCAFSRLPGEEYHLRVPGPAPEAIHVVDAAAAGERPDAPALRREDGYRAITLERDGHTYAVIAAEGEPSELAYDAPAGATHVVIDAPAGDGDGFSVSAEPSETGCRVRVSPGADDSAFHGHPLILRADAGCAVTPEEDAMGSTDGGELPPPPEPSSPGAGADEGGSRAGCSLGGPGTPLWLAGGLAVLALLGLGQRIRRRARR